ncbi:uncharacterized protein LOC142639955 [Castanea sativa]|uniref:uncharacterized protein LOC142639955 n=1 Tax=Castanea sativa TaxID=21020 RepID=UPI003F64C11E
MVFGDRNTSFYHLSAIVRSKMNRISAIKNSVGDWLFEESDIMDHINKSFKELYSTSQVWSDWHTSSITSWQLSLTESDRDNLDAEVSDEEIKAALWSLKGSKAQGPNGLHAGFFQRFWLIVGDSVKAEVKRPISLCNTVYKIITKIIVARLRPILGELISLFQIAFVPGRRGTDNDIIVQELIHTISEKNGRVGYMVIKIDLEKGYDKLERSFIRDILGKANIPENLIQVIMSCVLTVSTSVLFNGGCLEEFCPSRAKVSDNIDRVNKNFLWGSFESSKKMHWIGREKVTKPKGEGGLGLQTTKERNISLLVKLNWRFQTEADSLWAKVIKSKYCSQQRLRSRISDKLPCSQLRSSKAGGSRVLPLESEKLKIRDVFDEIRWNWDLIPFVLRLNCKKEIQAIPFALTTRSQDRLAWVGAKHGDFDLHNAYRLAGNLGSVEPFHRKWVWDLKTLPRIHFFLWKCCHNSVRVRERLAARGISTNVTCPLCQSGVETISHAL